MAGSCNFLDGDITNSRLNNRKKNIFNRLLKLGLLICAAVGLVLLVFPFAPASLKELAFQTQKQQEISGSPARIKIPNLNVDAAIEQVAIASDGTMDVPKLPHDTAWYKLGPRPGEIGSAVIAGHVDWYFGTKAVFANLHTLKTGDKIAVEDDKGITTSFVVTASRTYAASADATDVFTSKDGKAHLNLITCLGVWDKRAKTYSQRLVIFTDKE